MDDLVGEDSAVLELLAVAVELGVGSLDGWLAAGRHSTAALVGLSC